MLGQAAAGIQGPKMFWIPVFTGMTNYAGSGDFSNSLLKMAVGHRSHTLHSFITALSQSRLRIRTHKCRAQGKFT